MINIRKILNFSSAQHKKIIDNDLALINERCTIIAKSEYKDQIENKQYHDNKCPHCKKDVIVDKIVLSQSKSKITGSVRFGFGEIDGNVMVTTTKINHCNACGNEWEKFKTKYITATDILRVALNYFAEIIDNPEERNKSWKADAILVFSQCHAESIYRLCRKNENYLHDNGKKHLTLKSLRKHFNSVYDLNTCN